MANVIIDDTYLQDIADSIRAKTGSQAGITPSEMSDEIDSIPTGGGGSALEYEEGTLSTTGYVARTKVDFVNQHTKAPKLILAIDTTGTQQTTNSSIFAWVYIGNYSLIGSTFPGTDSGENDYCYAVVYCSYRNKNGTFATGTTACTHTLDEEPSSYSDYGYPRFWATEKYFNAGYIGSNAYWRADRTYKWIAIWK